MSLKVPGGAKPSPIEAGDVPFPSARRRKKASLPFPSWWRALKKNVKLAKRALPCPPCSEFGAHIVEECPFFFESARKHSL